jgi:flagellar biosynthesis/type III secretory pathway chaperone
MQTTLSKDNIKRLIDAELELATQLQQLLQQENDVLSHRFYSELPAITEQKIRLVEQLEARANQRQQIVAPDASAKKAWQGLVSKDALLKDSWDQLQQELDLCKRVNRINELVVNRSLKATQRVLSIIRGGSIEQDLYSKAGDKVKARAVGSYLSV